MVDGVKPIVDAALSGSNMQLMSGNHIRLEHVLDQPLLKITMHVAGYTELWVTYDAPQLDELIRNLQTAREDLR